MGWDFEIDKKTGDMTGRRVNKQDEIVQRVMTRLLRHLGEWFANTSAGVPWYAGASDIIAGQLTRSNGILGSRKFREAAIILRGEIADTRGVIQILNFKANFDSLTRVYSIRADIVTEYGLPAPISLDYAV